MEDKDHTARLVVETGFVSTTSKDHMVKTLAAVRFGGTTR